MPSTQAKTEDAKVVEIGCGDGRDAEEIIKRTAWYEGFDPSEGLLRLARKKLPHARFVKTDASAYEYAPDLDVVFAFASLLHVDMEEFNHVLDKVRRALKPGGIFYVSLKEKPAYHEEAKQDMFGERMFYYYSVDDILQMAGGNFACVHEDHQTIGKTVWFTLALQNRPESAGV